MKLYFIPIISVLLLVALNADAASLAPQQTETRSFALIVSNQATGPSSQLAGVLTDQYGFQVKAVTGRNATAENIEAAMFELAKELNSYDQLFVHISLPVSKDPNLYYLPAGTNPEDRWKHLSWSTIQRWLSQVESGPSLITYPSCARGKRSAYNEPNIEELAYSIGKRWAPIEILQVCDPDAIRTQSRNPETRFSEWRSELVAESLITHLSDVVSTRSANTLSNEEISADNLLTKLNAPTSLALEYSALTIPLHQKARFRFIPVENNNAYEARYTQASNFDSLNRNFLDYQSASSKSAALRKSFISFAEKIAASPSAASTISMTSSQLLQIRRNAINALGQRTKEQAAKQALITIATTTSDSASLRRSAVVALGRAAKPLQTEDMAALKQASSDESSLVREAAYVALAQSNDPNTPEFLVNAFNSERDGDVRRIILLALSRFARQADTPLYVTALSDPNPEVRSQSASTLANLAPSNAINDALLARFKLENNERTLTTIAHALGYSAPESAKSANIELLKNALSDSTRANIKVRSAVISSLGELGGNDAASILNSLVYGNKSPDEAIAATKALGQMKSESSVTQLEKVVLDQALEYKQPKLVVAAIEALAEIDTPSSAKSIWKILESATDLRVREAAHNSLAKMTFVPATIERKLDSKLVHVRETAVAQASNSDDSKAQEMLLEALSDSNSKVQQLSIKGLSKRKASELSDSVERIYDNSSTRVKVNLIRALGQNPKQDSKWVNNRLLSASKSKSPEVRAAAIESLANYSDENSIAAVIEASKEQNEQVRNTAIQTLGNYQSKLAEQRLQEIVKEEKGKHEALKAIDKQKVFKRSSYRNK